MELLMCPPKSPIIPLFLYRTTTKISAATTSTQPPSITMDKENRAKRVVVCGGGVIGVCTAYFLAKKGAAVTLIEQSSIACAASGKAGGFLALDWCDDGSLSSLARASFELHRSLATDLDGSKSYGYRPLHTLSLTIADSGTSQSSDSSIPDWVDGPTSNPRTIGTTSTTAQVNPEMFTETVLDAAVRDHGAAVVIGKVERLEMEDGRVKSVVLAGGRAIETHEVVLALGPWSARFQLLASLFKVSGLKAHSVVLEPKKGEDITPHALFLTYYPSHGGKPMDPEVYPRPTGEVYVCGMSSEAEVPENAEQVTASPDAITALLKVAGTVSSYLREDEAEVKAKQACFLPCTDDGMPVIGELPGTRGCYVATGHSCWGILNGPATGAAVAELVVDGRATIVDLACFSPARFLRRRSRVR